MLVLAASLLPVTWSSSLSHDWYDYDCCSDKDCRQLLESEIHITEDGYLVETNHWLVPFDSKLLRTSKDGKFHGCFRAGDDRKGELLCLYVPSQGS